MCVREWGEIGLFKVGEHEDGSKGPKEEAASYEICNMKTTILKKN